MPSTVIGLFDNLATAQRVEEALERADFLRERIFLAAIPEPTAAGGEGVPVPPPTGNQLPHGDLKATLVEHGVPEDRAQAYAEGIRDGGAAVLLLNLDDEHAERAARVLLSHRPIDPSHRLRAFHEHGRGGYNPVASPFNDTNAPARNPLADDHPRDGVAVVYVM
jgi:hypothetical protein